MPCVRSPRPNRSFNRRRNVNMSSRRARTCVVGLIVADLGHRRHNRAALRHRIGSRRYCGRIFDHRFCGRQDRRMGRPVRDTVAGSSTALWPLTKRPERTPQRGSSRLAPARPFPCGSGQARRILGFARSRSFHLGLWDRFWRCGFNGLRRREAANMTFKGINVLGGIPAYPVLWRPMCRRFAEV